MLVEFHDRFLNPERRQATRVVVRDDHGNPVVVVLRLTTGHLTILTPGQQGFAEALHCLGLAAPTVDEFQDRE